MLEAQGAVLLCVMVSQSSGQLSRFREKQKAENSDRFNFFDLELLKSLASTPQENLLFSPASVKAALAMILEGAGGLSAKELKDALRLPDEERETRTQFKNFLNSLQDNKPGYKVEAANQIFLSDTVAPQQKYETLLKSYYMSEIEKVDFTKPGIAAQTINRWVNMLTHGLIPTLVTPGTLSANTKLLLVNAMYFKGKWKHAFDYDKTTVKCFYVEVNQCLDTYFMEIDNVYNYAYVRELEAHAIELPYEGERFSLLLLAPSKRNAVQQLIRDLAHVSLYNLVSSLQPTEIHVAVPRFSIDYNTDLTNRLAELGIQDVFSQNANLSGIVQGGTPDLHISNILHKAKIEVNEEGTVAAAATGSLVVPLMGAALPKLIFNHPFLFFLRNTETGDVLFAGRLNEPEAAKAPAIGSQLSEAQLSELSQGIFTPKPTGSPIGSTLNPGINFGPVSTTGSGIYNPASSGSNINYPLSSTNSSRLPPSQNNPSFNTYNSSPNNLNIGNNVPSLPPLQQTHFSVPFQQRSAGNAVQYQTNGNTGNYQPGQAVPKAVTVSSQYAPTPTQYSRVTSRSGSYAFATNSAQYPSSANGTPQGSSGGQNTNERYNDRIHFS